MHYKPKVLDSSLSVAIVMVRSRQPVTRVFTTFYQIDVLPVMLPVTARNSRAERSISSHARKVKQFMQITCLILKGIQ